MFDVQMRKLIDPPLNAVGRGLAGMGINADGVTIFGLALGLGAAVCIALGIFWWGLLFIVLSRIADGLDGAVARATRKTDFGGYLDITADFVFYGAIPFAFIIFDPLANAIVGGFLLLSFYVNGASFLGYAILAEKHDMESKARGEKSLYFTGGILEGTETILLFVAMCVWPGLFGWFAWIFGALCFVTAGARVLLAWRVFRK